MAKMKLDKKTLTIGGIILGVVILAIVWFAVKSSSKQQANADLLQNEAPIPTVDSSVKVELETVKEQGGKPIEVSLIVKNAPKGTTGIDYELTYNAQGEDMGEGGGNAPTQQGVIGKCSKDEGSETDWTCKQTQSENIVLGTCSSGTCRYHKLLSPIKVTLKFTGNYGQKIFEKEYKL